MSYSCVSPLACSPADAIMVLAGATAGWQQAHSLQKSLRVDDDCSFERDVDVYSPDQRTPPLPDDSPSFDSIVTDVPSAVASAGAPGGAGQAGELAALVLTGEGASAHHDTQDKTQWKCIQIELMQIDLDLCYFIGTGISTVGCDCPAAGRCLEAMALEQDREPGQAPSNNGAQLTADMFLEAPCTLDSMYAQQRIVPMDAFTDAEVAHLVEAANQQLVSFQRTADEVATPFTFVGTIHLETSEVRAVKSHYGYVQNRIAYNGWVRSFGGRSSSHELTSAQLRTFLQMQMKQNQARQPAAASNAPITIQMALTSSFSTASLTFAPSAPAADKSVDVSVSASGHEVAAGAAADGEDVARANKLKKNAAAAAADCSMQ